MTAASAATMRPMRRTALVAAVVALALLASTVRADDPPGLALAKRAVEELRGDPHREKMRIVWPETGDEAPPEGAEVVLITGYIDYVMTRFVWRGGKVEAGSVGTARTWFYNSKGEGYGAWEFDVDPAAFAKAWAAARFLTGAKDERVEPAPVDHEWSSTGSSISHESSEYVRLDVPAGPSPLHCSDPHGRSGNWEGVRPWDEIRDRAAFAAFKPLLPDFEAARKAQVESWSPALTQEIRRAASRLDLRYSGEHHLLLPVCLRVAGEAGDAATLEAVEALARALGSDARGDWDASTVRRDLLPEIEIARVKLTLRHSWSTAAARAVLDGESAGTNADSDLRKWVRRRWRESDPATFLMRLDDEKRRGVAEAAGDLVRTLEAVRRESADVPLDTLRVHLHDRDADVRIAAARAILAKAPGDREAAEEIARAARDQSIHPDGSGEGTRWSRLDAIAEAGDRRILAPRDLRRLLET